MLLIYSDSKLKVPLMEQGHWESPDVRVLVNHLEGLPLILVYMSTGTPPATHTHTHPPQTCVPNDDHITNAHIWWKEFPIGISKRYHFHSKGLI